MNDPRWSPSVLEAHAAMLDLHLALLRITQTMHPDCYLDTVLPMVEALMTDPPVFEPCDCDENPPTSRDRRRRPYDTPLHGLEGWTP